MSVRRGNDYMYVWSTCVWVCVLYVCVVPVFGEDPETLSEHSILAVFDG